MRNITAAEQKKILDIGFFAKKFNKVIDEFAELDKIVAAFKFTNNESVWENCLKWQV